MKTSDLKLTTLFVKIDDLCKEKKISARAGRGRPSRLFPSEIATIYVWFLLSKVRSFKEFYNGPHGEFLRPFFPKAPSYSAFLKQLKHHSQALWELATSWDRTISEGRVAYIDSTPLPVCEDARHRSHRVFSPMANWAYSSTGAKFGLKMHLVVDEDQKIRNFTLKSGNLHDASCAEEVLENFQGTVLGDKGYCSTGLADRLNRRGIRLIARRKKNMTPNSLEERKLLRKRSLIETVIGKFKNFFGPKLSRFRSPVTAFSAVCSGVLAVNLS